MTLLDDTLKAIVGSFRTKAKEHLISSPCRTGLLADYRIAVDLAGMTRSLHPAVDKRAAGGHGRRPRCGG